MAGVMFPRRACSSCVTATNPSGAIARLSSTLAQPSGRKSHAVLSLGAGMPGVSGDENVSGPPICAAWAKDPGDVPASGA